MNILFRDSSGTIFPSLVVFRDLMNLGSLFSAPKIMIQFTGKLEVKKTMNFNTGYIFS